MLIDFQWMDKKYIFLRCLLFPNTFLVVLLIDLRKLQFFQCIRARWRLKEQQLVRE